VSDTYFSQAKARLMLEQPYFATMAGVLALEAEEGIATVSYEGDRLRYNPEYIDAISTEETMAILAHASMQQALYHTDRGRQKQGRVWQMASAYAINDLLMHNGFVLPPMALYSARFEKLYTEQIYAILLGEEGEQDPSDETAERDATTVEQGSPVPLLDDEAYTLALEQVLAKLSRRSDLPRGLERLLPQSQPTRLPWRELLYRYVNAHARSDYRLSPPNKKQLYRGVALPSVYGEELEIAVAIDTSASVDEILLQHFLSELAEIMQLFPQYCITLIECDAAIQHIQTLYPTESLCSTVHGGGGTDFRPVFEYIATAGALWKFLIYFTDGQGVFPEDRPAIDTLWVMPEAVEVPFGERIMIEAEPQ